MKIGFKNFAKAGSGNIRIGDLTVIFGPNNTGKTYVNYAIYSILRNFDYFVRVYLSDKKLSQLISELKSKGKAQLELPDFVKKLEKFRTSATPILNSKIHEYFQISEVNFQKSVFTIELEELDLSKPQSSSVEAEFGNTISLQYNYKLKKSIISLKLVNKNKYNKLIDEFDEKNKDNINTIYFSINLLLYLAHFGRIIPQPFPVTSERTGVSLFYKIFDARNSEILKRINGTRDSKQISKLASLHSQHALPIDSNIDDVRFYENLIKKQSALSKNKNFSDIIEVLSILLGNGEFESKNDSLFYKFNDTDNKSLAIPLHAASSSVKSLFLLDLFIKHVADKGNLLMIDEPELNLCVENQVRMARLVARLVNSGVKVLITTHSDFFIREINNLITLSHADKNSKSIMMEEYDIRKCDLLKPSQVSAYRTNNNGNVEEVEIMKTGIDTDFWNKLIQSENKKTEDIFFASGID